MGPQDFRLLFGELEHEILGKPAEVALDGAVESFGLDAVEFWQIHVEHDLLTADQVNPLLNALDWDDELRQAIESRTALSPDALTGMEANLRFGLPETPETRVFGRLSAWQNWIFIRPNAVGGSGALKVYGSGAPSKFNWERV